ncbi:thioredoxin domain-containing protein 17-like [Dreissena polymorpha]|uniref:Thioredoxin domain-containing protein 17 n=1 Tax=Dreissena polymorpha TaxID=45954 RepID=A0A9D4N954_DREPO|nr:thioredoxin domain-containing protein 17-like [Dreissena polymorpha]KAH3891335.1 hypothetical protein DPMN_015429 [Dreissena polymorpha]
MAKQLHVEGYNAYKAAEDENKDKTLFALFSGSAGADGSSWCPDCVEADPVINSSLSKLPKDAIFIHCGVGDRTYWKDQNNAFRKDPTLKLTAVPTLLKVGHSQRLVEEQCANSDLVEMLFTDD